MEQSGQEIPAPFVVSAPSRNVINSDAIDWLRNFPNLGLPGDVFTSIPDISEMDPQFGSRGREDFVGYKRWFEETVKLIMSKTARYCIFLQSDIRWLNSDGQVVEFIDKSYLINKAAEDQNFVLVWRKTCTNRLNPEQDRVVLRPAWSNLICMCRRGPCVNSQDNANIGSSSDTEGELPLSLLPTYAPYVSADFATPDVFPRGTMVWSRGIGLHAAVTGVSFLLHIAKTTCICDPFCGQGTVLALANAVGVSSLGCELCRSRAGQAARLDIRRELLEMGGKQREHYGLKLKLAYSELDLPLKPQWPAQKRGLPGGKQACAKNKIDKDDMDTTIELSNDEICDDTKSSSSSNVVNSDTNTTPSFGINK